MQVLLPMANRYAAELDTQFGTLAEFAKHSGEIGRAHEVYVRSVLRRLLPDRFRLGSGFVAGGSGMSKQEDVIVFTSFDTPLLYEVGDCVVVDEVGLAGCVEVKTTLDSARFQEAMENLLRLRKITSRRPCTGMFGWDGLVESTMLEQIWKWVKENGGPRNAFVPDLIYVRSKYLLMQKDDTGQWEDPPLWSFNVGEEGITDGVALLLFLCRLWQVGLNRFECFMPDWLSTWYLETRKTGKPVAWTEELLKQGKEARG